MFFLFAAESDFSPNYRETETRPHEQLSGRSVPPHPPRLPEEGPGPHREDGDHRDGHQIHQDSPR